MDNTQQEADNVKQMLATLVECLSSSDTSVVTLTVEALDKFLARTAFIESLNVVDVLGTVLSPLKNLLQAGAWEDGKEEVRLLERVTSALFRFTQFGEHGVDMLIEANVLPYLVVLLTHNDDEVQTKTIMLISGMLNKGSKDDVIAAVFGCRFLELVSDLLESQTSATVKEYTLISLGSILEDGNQSQFETVLSMSFLPKIAKLFKQGNPEIKLDTGTLLIILWNNALKHGLTTSLHKYGITEELMENAKCFCDMEQQAIIFMKFARALGLN